MRAQDQVFRCTGVSVCAYPHSLETQPGGSESHPEDKDEIMASTSGSNSCKRPCSDGKRCPEIPSLKLRRVLTLQSDITSIYIAYTLQDDRILVLFFTKYWMFHSNGSIVLIFYAILEESVNLITSRNVLFFPLVLL